MGHMLVTNKKAFDHLASHMAEFAKAPTWGKMTKLMGGTMVDGFRAKDFFYTKEVSVCKYYFYPTFVIKQIVGYF